MSVSLANAEPDSGTLKRVLIIFLVALCLLFATAAIHFLILEGAEQAKRENRETLNIRLGKAAIDRDLQDVISDLTFLARHNEKSGFSNADDPLTRQALAEQFRVFSAQKGKYDQIRVLDETGQEIVRVNYNQGDPVATGADRLQNKSDRYYFIETWALEGLNVYVSPFDLNVEHGDIQMPEVPMVRFGTLLMDADGNKQGVLLLNYLGKALIEKFRDATANIADHVSLLNSDGFWLSSPDGEGQWGFMFGQDATLGKSFPDAWQRINAEDSGQFYDDNGLFTFTTIYPVTGLPGQIGVASESQELDKSYYWKAVSHLPPRTFSTSFLNFVRQNLPLYAITFFLLTAASLAVVQTRFRHLQAVGEVEAERSFRGLLESRVEERTQELKSAQEEKDLVIQHLIQAEKMTAVGTMASGIGHEINNPLYAILGLAEAIRDDDDPAETQNHASKILVYTKDIAGIVKNLTGYARPYVGEEVEPADVNECIKKAISMVDRSLLDDRIKIQTDLADLPLVSAYGEEINQVFFNVFRNGIQAMKGEGVLEISSAIEGRNIVVRVTDTGEGIAADNLGKVFDPFFTTKDPDEGEGMGLYVVHQIIQKYKGSISFESVPGKGTTCLLEFPAIRHEKKEVTQ